MWKAATVPLTALTIMQALDLMGAEAGKTISSQAGQVVLAVWPFRLPKAKGLTVITNGDGTNAERVLALGADQFIDYKTEDYTDPLPNRLCLGHAGRCRNRKTKMPIMKKVASWFPSVHAKRKLPNA